MTNRPCVNKECKLYTCDKDNGCSIFRDGLNLFMLCNYTPCYQPEPQKPAEPQEIEFDMIWNGDKEPHQNYTKESTPDGYAFRCYEFDLPNNTKRWSTIPIMFMRHLTNNGTVELCTQIRDLHKYTTIRATKIIFERVPNEKI